MGAFKPDNRTVIVPGDQIEGEGLLFKEGKKILKCTDRFTRQMTDILNDALHFQEG
jgi:hypothetical protein